MIYDLFGPVKVAFSEITPILTRKCSVQCKIGCMPIQKTFPKLAAWHWKTYRPNNVSYLYYKAMKDLYSKTVFHFDCPHMCSHALVCMNIFVCAVTVMQASQHWGGLFVRRLTTWLHPLLSLLLVIG